MFRFFLVSMIIFSINADAGNTHGKPKDPEPREGSFTLKNRPQNFTQAVMTSLASLQRSPPDPLDIKKGYQIAQTDMTELLKSLFKKTQEKAVDGVYKAKKIFTILELSVVDTGWGKGIAEQINDQKISLPDNFEVRIIVANKATSELNVVRPYKEATYHSYNKISFDNIRSTIHETGEIDLLAECDLIVAGDVLYEAIDPLNLFCQLHSLLRPRAGLLFARGFPIYDEPMLQLLDDRNFYDHMNTNLHSFLTATGQSFLTQCERKEEQSYNKIGDIIYWRQSDKKINFQNCYGQNLHVNGNAGLACTYDLEKITKIPELGECDYSYKERRGPFDFWGDQELFVFLARRIPTWSKETLRNYMWTNDGQFIKVIEHQS